MEISKTGKMICLKNANLRGLWNKGESKGNWVINAKLYQILIFFCNLIPYSNGGININFMRRIGNYLFCSQKYFLDTKYQNISLETHNQLGSLHHLTKVFADRGINMKYIKSRTANAWTENKKYALDISIPVQTPQALEEIRQAYSDLGVIMEEQKPIEVPWFPRTFEDLNLIGKTLLDVKDEVNKDHPQFTDLEYRKRRDYIAQIAIQYTLGERIPDVPYAKEQTDLWKKIFAKLRKLHKSSMSQRYEVQMRKLEREFLFSERIPQLNELNSYLQNKTGFQIKPTHGILSQREFLNCLAFRVFCCTQYLRHTGTPDYTPEPDIVHEIVGHVPMFADPDVAELSQQLGLLSLGASDAQIAQLGTLYWFTLEFGVCKQGKKALGYGAGIASSIGQIQNLLSDKPKFKPLQPILDCDSEYPIQSVQEMYRVTESFDRSLHDLEEYGLSVMKPLTTTFNFSKKTIEYDRNIEAVFMEDKGPKF